MLQNWDKSDAFNTEHGDVDKCADVLLAFVAFSGLPVDFR